MSGTANHPRRQRGPLARLAALVTAFVVLGALLAPAAEAVVWWNSRSAPLTVTGYGSVGRGYGYLEIRHTSSGTMYRARTFQKIWRADINHRVYARLVYFSNSGICFAPSFAQCRSSWFVHTSDKTEPTKYAGYASDWEYAPIDGYANFHRLRARIVLAIPWRPDPSSGYAYTNGIEW